MFRLIQAMFSRPPARPVAASRRIIRSRVESLESRCMLSTVSLGGDELYFGRSEFNNGIIVNSGIGRDVITAGLNGFNYEGHSQNDSGGPSFSAPKEPLPSTPLPPPTQPPASQPPASQLPATLPPIAPPATLPLPGAPLESLPPLTLPEA